MIFIDFLQDIIIQYFNFYYKRIKIQILIEILNTMRFKKTFTF